MCKCVILVIATWCLMQMTACADEFWAVADAKLKGDDYLYVVNVEKPDPPFRRLRCRSSLPLYVEEMARAAERVEGQILLRVRATIVAEPSGERVEDIKILMVCLASKESYPLLTAIKKWEQYPQALPEEKVRDPFIKDM